MGKPAVNWRLALALTGLLVVVVLLWNTWFVYPLRLLVVFLHELSHALIAIVTGGSVVGIQLDPREGGLALTRGGWPFFIASAGYLGSLIWGGVFLTLAVRSKSDKGIMTALGVLLLGVTALWARPVLSFGFGFGALTGVALVLSGVYLRMEINDFLLKLIGLTSCLYAVLDIKSDILDRPEMRSDAAILAELTGVPTLFWGVLWFVIAILAAGYFLRTAVLASPGGIKRNTGKDIQTL